MDTHDLASMKMLPLAHSLQPQQDPSAMPLKQKLYSEALALLELVVEHTNKQDSFPLIHYTMGVCHVEMFTHAQSVNDVVAVEKHARDIIYHFEIALQERVVEKADEARMEWYVKLAKSTVKQLESTRK